ncbi:MAG: BON domain-containing protein [Acidobacteriota bacterium]
MPRLPIVAPVVVLAVALEGVLAAQAPPRALIEALGSIYRLRNYTAFDWIGAHYLRGTLTLQGFVRTPQLKADAAAAARKVGGIEEIVNNLEVLPTLQQDDDVRIRAYAAIYGSSALSQYAPGGHLSDFALSELADTARFGLEGTDVGRGPHPIHIVVSGSRVILLGEVRATGDRRIAESTIRTLPGVLGVTNQLRVAGQK